MGRHFNRFRRDDAGDLTQEKETELAAGLRAAYPAVKPPEGLEQRLTLAALTQGKPLYFRTARLALLPAVAVVALLLGALSWRVPGLRAQQITAQMRAAWETVRDYQGQARCYGPILGRTAGFQLRLWYRRPGDVRADVTGENLQATILVSGSEARVIVPALATDVVVPLEGDFAVLRNLSEVGEALRRLEEMRELRVVASERVAGQDCYVLHYHTSSLLDRCREWLGVGEQISSRTTQQVGQVAVSGKVWVSKATLLPMKAETYGADRNVLVTAAFEKVTVNGGVDEKVFRLPGRESARHLRAYTWQELIREAAGAAEQLWRQHWQ